MKKHLVSMLMVCVMVLFGAGIGFAGQGMGTGNGTGPLHDILSGVPFTVEGTVVGFAPDGSLILSTISGDIQLYGIGPAYYWESQGAAYPEFDLPLIATGFIVDYNGIDRHVVMTVTTEDGTTFDLRDPETAKPLWRGTNGVSAGPGPGGSVDPGNGNTGGNGGNGGTAGSGGSKGGACK